MLSLHLRLGLPSGLFLSGFPTNNRYIKTQTKTNKLRLIDASKEVGLEVNVDETNYMFVSRDQNAGQNRNIKIGNSENVSQFKYL
jgi:hypothetical protein